MTFERVIVWPDGHREIEGVTPKSLPAPSPCRNLLGELMIAWVVITVIVMLAAMIVIEVTK